MTGPLAGNLLADLPARSPDERIDTLLAHRGARIERIVSTGQASPKGFWYDQEEDEFVLLLAGSAGLSLEGEDVRTLVPGDWLHLPAHCRHRVDWTAPDGPTIWLAIFLPAAQVS